MTYTAAVLAQDTTTGRIAVIANAIAAAAAMLPYDSADVAVAYATRRGVELLNQRLVRTGWTNATKRFLISVDFGVTEPDALAALAALSNAQVRVPNGLAVLASQALKPPSTFHPKAYTFRVSGCASQLAMVVGSANMTASALATGAEVVTVQTWSENLSAAERALLSAARPLLDWFEDSWNAANPLTDVLPAYRLQFKGRRRPQATRDDDTPAAEAYSAPAPSVEVTGPLAVQLLAAQALWIKTEELYHNRGPGKPGNQLDTPRGTRVFFGFPAAYVSKNTVLGYVALRVPGFDAVTRSVRFADNVMDKVNLPIPGSFGPASYDHAYLIFERTGTQISGRALFHLTVTDLDGLNDRKAQSRHTIELEMAGGRPYGLLF